MDGIVYSVPEATPRKCASESLHTADSAQNAAEENDYDPPDYELLAQRIVFKRRGVPLVGDTVMITKKAAYSRWVRQSRRWLPVVLALISCNGATADEPEKASQRDGVWLRNGIDHYARLSGHESLSENDANSALAVRSYVCAVVDLEKYLVLRADLLAGAVREARKKHHIHPEKLNGMAEALPILVPLMRTKFTTDNPPCDLIVLGVREYLEKYPEMLTKDADVIIEKALLDRYSQIDEP